MNITTTNRNISESQRQVLLCIKQQGKATTAMIAEKLQISYEAVRQQLRQLEASQMVVSSKQRDDDRRLGPPTHYYKLSSEGDHFFPKAYDELAIDLIDTLVPALGPDALRQVLTSFTDTVVHQWLARLKDKPLEDRLEALRGLYIESDAYMHVDIDEASNTLRLVERNCPFLNVAAHRPALCSVTISTLSRLLGYKVMREERFQDGDGRCVFRVLLDQQINSAAFRFGFEEELNSSQPDIDVSLSSHS